MSGIIIGRKPGGGGGTGGPETDPVATVEIAAHETAADPHGDRADATGKVTAHTAAVDPHGDRASTTAAVTAHRVAVDPHGDRADATTKVAAHVAAVDPHGDRADAAGKVGAHVAAVDPHGDRAYTDTRVAAVVGASPAALDTLAEIDTQLASDEAGAAAMLASINANTAAIALKAAQADLLAHENAAAGAHAASAVSVNPAGLAVVTTANVQAALAQLDAWANGRPRSGSGTLVQLPADADATWPNESTFFVTDQFGGVTYRRVAGHWTPQSAGILQNTGWQLAAGPVLMSSLFDVKAVGTTETDIPLMSIPIPASATRGILIRFRSLAVLASGTAASGSGVTVQLYLTDSANTHISGDFPGGQSVAGAAFANLRTVVLEKYLAPPVAAMTYKLRARLSAAAPANWGGATIDPTAISNIADSSALYAVYAA